MTVAATPALLRRFVVMLASSIILLLLAGTALASIDTSRPVMSTQQLGMSGVEPGHLPDVALLVGGAGGDVTAAIETSLLPALREIDGVHSVAGESVGQGRHAVYISIDDRGEPEILGTITAAVDRTLPDTPVLVGGRAVADRDLLDRLNRSLIVAVAPVMILLAVLVAVSLGGRYGLAVSASVALASVFSGLAGAQFVGQFDGSLATTAVPAVFAGVLVSTVLAFRLLDWFTRPQGDDQAEALRRAVRYLAPEVGLLVGGIVGTAVLLEIVGPGRTPAVGVAVGAVIATLVTFSVLPAMLATMSPVPDGDDTRLFRLSLPDGRDVPSAILAGLAVFLLCFGLFAVRLPSSELLDESALPSGVTTRSVAEVLRASGGDPTSAVLATIGDEGEPVVAELVASWARTVSALPEVGWVETAMGRFADGELVVAADEAGFRQSDAYLAVITPATAARSLDAQELGAMIESIDVGGVSVTLSGVPIDAAEAGRVGVLPLVLLVVALAVAAMVAALVTARNLRTAVVVGVLRVVGIVSALAIYQLVVGDATMSELQLVALVVSVGVGLFEIGLLRRLEDSIGAATASLAIARLDDADVMAALDDAHMSEAIRREGRAAVLGMSVVAVCGLGFLASDLEAARRLGIGLAAAMVVELLIGTWLLRPALLAHRLRWVRFTPPAVATRAAVEPAADVPVSPVVGAVEWFRIATRRVSGTVAHLVASVGSPGLSPASGHDPIGASDGTVKASNTTAAGGIDMTGFTGSTGQDETGSAAGRPMIDPQWRRIVQGLLRAEFSFQNDPASAELSTVFVEDTPVYAELLEHNQRLRVNGFRVVGKGPRLVKAQAVDDSSPVTIAITVDHPERRLVDRDGRLLGVRRPERRAGMLWLAQDPSGRYRITEAVDLGTAVEPALGELPPVTPTIALTV